MKQLEIICGNLWTKLETDYIGLRKLRNLMVLQIFDYSQSGSIEGGALDCS